MNAVEAGSAGRTESRLGSEAEAARKRAVVETYARHAEALRRTARRYSLCADDADDALQRGLEILLRKAPSEDPRELVKWTQTVVKHEAMAIRRDRERILAGPAAVSPEVAGDDWIALLPAASDGPPERAERREAIARSREALQALKPQELRALTLLAAGYSYAEIGEITGYTRTKVNRCLAEGRERFRKLISGGEDGSRCGEMRPLLSAFCDGEATPEEVGRLREHLRACAHCRATLRAYRAAPAAAGALAPLLPLDRSLLERAQDAIARLADRFGGGGESLPQVAIGGGGAGAPALLKVTAACVATAGSVAVCAVTGLVPSLPVVLSERDASPRLERPAEAPAGSVAAPKTAATVAGDEAPAGRHRPARSQSEHGAREVPEAAEPIREPTPEASGAAEHAPSPAPEPVAEPAPEQVAAPPAPSTGGSSPAGEFGP